jgi:hypothetical protein
LAQQQNTEQKKKTTSESFGIQAALTVLSIFIIVIFFHYGKNAETYEMTDARGNTGDASGFWGKVKSYYDEYSEQIDEMDVEKRYANRTGLKYTFTMAIADSLKKNNTNIDSALILVPPDDFLGKVYHPSIQMPEPSIAYLYAGIHTATLQSANVKKANYCFAVKANSKGEPIAILKPIRDSFEVNMIIKNIDSVLQSKNNKK